MVYVIKRGLVDQINYTPCKPPVPLWYSRTPKSKDQISIVIMKNTHAAPPFGMVAAIRNRHPFPLAPSSTMRKQENTCEGMSCSTTETVKGATLPLEGVDNVE